MIKIFIIFNCYKLPILNIIYYLKYYDYNNNYYYYYFLLEAGYISIGITFIRLIYLVYKRHLTLLTMTFFCWNWNTMESEELVLIDLNHICQIESSMYL